MLVVPAKSQEGTVGVASKWEAAPGAGDGGKACNEAPLPPQAEAYVTYEPPVVDNGGGGGTGAASSPTTYSGDEELQ